MTPRRKRLLIGLAFVAMGGLAAWEILSLDAEAENLALHAVQCEEREAELGKRFRRAVSERDFAIDKAERADRMMRSTAAAATDSSLARLRAEEMAAACRGEADRLRAAVAAPAPAVVMIETGSIAKPDPPKAAAKPRKAVRRAPERTVEPGQLTRDALVLP